MALPQITVTIDPPLVSDSPEQFNIKAFAAWQTLAQLTPQVNAWSIQVDAAGVVTLQAKADAQAAATSANASKDAAAASAASASGSATSANASKDAAAASAASAASSASAASTSKDAAAASATTATNAATSATSSKDAAAASATTASSAATSATASKDAAAASAATASNAATSANASKDAAAASATTASNAATSATSSKAAAAASATTASNAATSATASKDAAAASATAAANSAASIAGGPVANVNGATGIVTLKTVEGTDLVGTGNIAVDVAAKVHAATAKATPADADELGLSDSAASWALKKLTFANLKTWIAGLFVSRTSAQIAGNLSITGTGRRITGDFTNGVVANRVAFQSSAANSDTALHVIPNGSGTRGTVEVSDNSDLNNTSIACIRIDRGAGVSAVEANKRGTGAFLPLTFWTGAGERVRIATNGWVGIGTTAPSTPLEVAGVLTLGRCDPFFEGGELAFARSSDNSSAFTIGVHGAGSTPNLRVLNVANGNTLPLYINGVNNNIGFGTTTTNAKLQLDNAIDPNGYDVGKIRFYENGAAICGIGVSAGQVNYRAADDHVLWSGTTEAARINHVAGLTLKGRLRVGHTVTFNALNNATDWLRLCTFNGTNMPRYVRFLLSSYAHDNWLVEFSPGAGGDNIRAKVTLLGTFGYFSIYPLQWRIVGEGTNAPCHIDIKFGGATILREYFITVLESYSLSGTSSMATFPGTNVGTSVNGGAGDSFGVQLGTTSGFTYREVELVPGYYARIGNDLARTTGTIAVNTVVV